MKIIAEFKEFAMRGNVVDLAVGLAIGAAFGKITTSLVNDVIMPPIGLILGKVDFSELYFNLSKQPYASLAEARAAGAPTLNYGAFLTAVLDFLIIAFVIFIVVKQINKLKRKEEKEPAPQKLSPEAELLVEIREELKKRQLTIDS